MSKYGMIFRDPVSNKMKIKLYSEPDGQLKGDGLCDYIRVSTIKFQYNIFLKGNSCLTLVCSDNVQFFCKL